MNYYILGNIQRNRNSTG